MECCNMFASTPLLCVPDTHVVIMLIVAIPAATLLGQWLRRFRRPDAGASRPADADERLAA